MSWRTSSPAHSALAGSGLRSGRLARTPQTVAPLDPAVAPPAAHPPNARHTPLLLGISAAAILLLIAIVIFLLTRPGGGNSAATDPADATAASAPAADQSPNFCGIPLGGETIVYVLDRGDSTREPFGHLKEAFYRSIETLGSDRRFQVIFWSNGNEFAYPAGVPTYATRENIHAAKRAMNDLYAFGQTDVSSALTKAMAGNPSEIVVATAKAWQLEDDFIETVLRIRGESNIPIHTVAIGGSGNNHTFRQVAHKTAGRHIELTTSDLASHAQ
jgi:hypothetical protein